MPGHRARRRSSGACWWRGGRIAPPKPRTRHALRVRRDHRGAGDRGGGELPHAQRPRGRHRAAAGDGRAQAARGALAPRRRHRGRRRRCSCCSPSALATQSLVARAVLSTHRLGRLRRHRHHRRSQRRARAAGGAAAVGARAGDVRAAGRGVFPVFPAVRRAVLGAAARRSRPTTGLSDEMSPGSISKLANEYDPAFRVRFEGTPPPQAALYWRGPVLNDFDGFTWRRERGTYYHRGAPRHAGRADSLSHHARADQPALAVRARHRGASPAARHVHGARPAAVGDRADHQHHELRRGLAPARRAADGHAVDLRTPPRDHAAAGSQSARARAGARASRAHRQRRRIRARRARLVPRQRPRIHARAGRHHARLGRHHAVRQQARLLRPLRIRHTR